MDPDFTTVHYQLGWIYQQSGQFQQAIQSIERVVLLPTKFRLSLQYVGHVLPEQGYHLGEALALAKWAVEFKPVSSYQGALSHTPYIKNGHIKEADEAIKKHLNCIPINLTICHTNKLLNRVLSISRGRAPLRRNAWNITILNPSIGRPRKDKKIDKTNIKQDLDTDTIPVMLQDPFLSWEALGFRFVPTSVAAE